MENESLQKLQRALRELLFNEFNHDRLHKLNTIVSLCNYYNSDNISLEINEEFNKMNNVLLNYELLNKLTYDLRNLTDKKNCWEPGFNRNEIPQNVTLSPTFNIGSIDLSGIINEIEKIRNEINNYPVNFNLLISFIAKRAEENGDLN